MTQVERKRTNPFYVILVVVGVAFVVTACAYFVMALKQVHAGGMLDAAAQLESQAAGSARFVEWVDRYGVRLMIGELLILGIATFAAIGTDRFWA